MSFPSRFELPTTIGGLLQARRARRLAHLPRRIARPAVVDLLEDRILLSFTVSAQVLPNSYDPSVLTKVPVETLGFRATAVDDAPGAAGAGIGFTFDWGDGTPADTFGPTPNYLSGSLTHAYQQPGVYSVQVTANDVNGAVATTALAVTISAGAAVVDFNDYGTDSLYIAGTSGSDNIEVRRVLTTSPATQNGFAVVLNGVDLGTYYLTVDTRIYVRGFGGDDTITIDGFDGIGNRAFYDLDGGTGSNTYSVNIGSGSYLDSSFDPLVVVHDEGTSHLIFKGTAGNDSIFKTSYPDGTSGKIYALGGGNVNDPLYAEQSVEYFGIQGITIDGGAGNDTIHDPGAGTTILGGSGNDTINITATTGSGVAIEGGTGSVQVTVNLGNLAGPVTVAGTGATGMDTVAIVGAPGDNSVTLTRNQVHSGAQTINITSPVSSLAINGNVGNTQVTVSNFTAAVSGLTVTGQGATNVTAQDLGSTAVQSLTVTGGPDPSVNHVQILGSPPPQVSTENVSPTIAPIADASFLLGGEWSVAGTFSDSDTDESWAGTVNYGDGSGNQPLTLGADKSFVLGHAYGAAGFYPVTVTVNESQGGVGTMTFHVTVLPPASLSGVVFDDFNGDGQVDFGEKGISGVPITLTGTDDLGHTVNLSQATDGDGAYVFLNLRPGTYTTTEVGQPTGYAAGIATVGTAGGTLSGAQFSVGLAAGVNALNYNYGEQALATGPIRHGQTAEIGFWNNKKGQALIKSLNGGPNSTQLGNWLADTFPNMYGINAGNKDLAARTNTAVAAFFQSCFVLKGIKVDAQVLSTALSTYVTNASLDNTGAGTQYGFVVSGDGVGTSGLFDVGDDGADFGVANHTKLTLMELLKWADSQAIHGVLFNGNTARRLVANLVFGLINEAGEV